MDGACELAFRPCADGTTALANLYQRAPCRVLFPRTETAEPVQAVLLTTSGGLTGGDRVRVAVQVEPRASVSITSQGAERIYRARAGSPDVDMRIDLQIGCDAWAEWLVQETLLFDGARLRRTFGADISQGGRLLALETLVFGRTAMRESFDTGLLHDAWQIRRNGGLVWVDAVHLQGDIRRLRGEPFGFGTAVACATLLYVGEDAASHLGSVRMLLSSRPVSGAATVLDGVLIARLLADRADILRSVVAELAANVRHAAGGWPTRMPRVWHC